MLKWLRLQWYLLRLRASDDEVRDAAAEELGKLGDARAVEPLISVLTNDDANVRRDAITALGKLGDARAVQPLISVLTNDDTDARRDAITALGELGDARAVEPLISAVSSVFGDVRRAAASALAVLGHGKWAQWIDGDEYDFARIGHSGDPDAVKRLITPLIRALSHSSQFTRHAAVTALGELGDARAVEPLISALTHSDGDVRRDAVTALGKLGDARAVESLISALTHSDGDVHRAAVTALGKLGDVRAVEPLVSVLKNDDADVRRDAVTALGKLGDARAVEPLIIALTSNFGDIRRAAASSLAVLGHRKWAQWVKGDNRDFVRLGFSRNPDTVKPLISALTSDHANVRRAAATALGELGDARAVEPLVSVLTNNDAEVRRAAVTALGKLGDARAVEPLISALTDDDADVRRVAAAALFRLGHREWAQWIKGDDRDFARLARSRDPNPDRVQPLISVLKNDDADVRRAAAVSLSRLGHGKWARWVKGDDCDFERIGKSGDPDGLQLLIDFLGTQSVCAILAARNDWRLRGGGTALYTQRVWATLAAASTLAKLGDARAVAPLRGFLLSESNSERRAAAEALIELARNHPAVLQHCWHEVASLVTPRHMDHTEYKSSDCDIHTDQGIGMYFPARPTKFPPSAPPAVSQTVADRIAFACSACGKRINAPKRLAGRTANCPNCKAIVRIPVQLDVKPDF